MDKPIQLIVGLGNPGPEYAKTRHNAGAWWVERIASTHNVTLKADPKYHGYIGRLLLHGQDIRLLIPATYMNLSGQSVAAVASFFKLTPEEILVAHDELDLPPGTAKLKKGGGHGGHNGLKDIISRLGNQNSFVRLRIGIGHPGAAPLVSNFVLGKAPSNEQRMIDDAIEAALQQFPSMLGGHLSKAMNTLNGFKAEA